ncbi:hypothetical protein PM082_014745 [Marasmius tenuissimus]|nr:hypothetical protein PM082_014745 [Marasmius tenuissimus]
MLGTSGLTTLPPSVPSSTPTDSNTSASNSFRAKIIGGAVGGGGFLIVLIVIFLFRRRRSKQARVRLQDPDKAAAVIDPFTPTTTVSNPPRERKELPSMPVLSRKAMEGSSRRVTEPTGGEQSTDPRQSHTEQEADESGQNPTLVHDNGPIDRASYRAMQAQVQLLMQKMERMESIEEGPPEYVSAYGSSR